MNTRLMAAVLVTCGMLIATSAVAQVDVNLVKPSVPDPRTPAPPGVGSLIVVTPSDTQGWAPANENGGGVSVISGVQPRSGTGSLDQSLIDNGSGGGNSSKTDYEIFSSDVTYVVGEGLKAPGGGFGLLSEMSSLLFEWYRDSSSTAPDHLTPALRLWLWDPDAGGPHGTSYYVIWEGVYNDWPTGPVPTDTWVTEEEMADDFFWRIPQFENGVWRGISWCNTPPNGPQCFDFDNTLGDWGFGANTVVFGINTGLGSGWAGSYQGYTDNVTIAFSETTTWNFELDAVPTASTGGLTVLAVMLGAGLLRLLLRPI